MPRYEYECPKCGKRFELDLPLSLCDTQPICLEDGGFARKIFTKLTTTYKDKDRPWGRSLYRSHQKGEKIGRERRKG